MKLLVVIDHLIPNKLRLFTMNEEHETGANNVIESMHRFFQDRSKHDSLSWTLFVQLYNCTREHKNSYLVSYLQALILWGVFDDVEVGFLPTWHTHEDIDQSFSYSSERLRNNNSITLEVLQFQFRQTYNHLTWVTHHKRIANWSGLCEQ